MESLKRYYVMYRRYSRKTDKPMKDGKILRRDIEEYLYAPDTKQAEELADSKAESMSYFDRYATVEVQCLIEGYTKIGL